MNDKLKNGCVAIALSMAVVAMASGAATATTSYQGQDYSYDYNAKKYIKNCDKESDNTSTKGIYDFNSTGGSDGNVSDQDGNNTSCASRNTGTAINRHRTCENGNWWPDQCGNWVAS